MLSTKRDALRKRKKTENYELRYRVAGSGDNEVATDRALPSCNIRRWPHNNTWGPRSRSESLREQEGPVWYLKGENGRRKKYNTTYT